MIKTISINGFRGFGSEQTVVFSLPDHMLDGSGLSIIIGANNSGKTTIVEAIRVFNHEWTDVFFSEGRRNKETNGKVSITLTSEDGIKHSITSIETGGAAAEKDNVEGQSYYVVPSRRAFQVYFYCNMFSKEDYIRNSLTLENMRTSELREYGARILDINKKKKQFDPLIKRILGNDFEWFVELSDTGQYYIKYNYNGVTHTGEGVGDGIWSIFTMCAALFDSKEGDTIVIDEPELSIHPSLQRKMMKVFMEYSRDRQIIISTHSPYFVSWKAIINGASLIRVSKENSNTICRSVSDAFRKFAAGLIKDEHNPHALGINATEAFFLEDNIVLVEGQEDVIGYSKILRKLGIDINGEFFGWGVGGEPKMSGFLNLFYELGYRKIVAIYDGDKADEANSMQQRYPDYRFYCIPTEDIRDKESRPSSSKTGIIDKHWNLKKEYEENMIEMFDSINQYLES